VNDEIEKTLKESAVACFKQYPGTEESTKNLSQNSQSSGRYLNPGPPKYEPGLLNTRSVYGP